MTTNTSDYNEEVIHPDTAHETGHDTARDEPSETGDELSGMEQAVNAAEQELLLHRDAMLRMQAEMDNLRKRLIRDQERARKFALENMMKDLLQVRDSLERALEIVPENATVESLREGEELTLKLLSKVLGDRSLMAYRSPSRATPSGKARAKRLPSSASTPR